MKLNGKLSKLNLALISIIVILSLYIVYSLIKPIPKVGFFILSKDQAAKKAIDFINENLVQKGTKAELVSVEEISGVYKVLTKYQGNEIPVYITKDGKYLFVSSPLDTSQKLRTEETQPQQQPQQQTPEIPKSDKPEVKLFVMTYCPFGLQMEKALLPVIDLLKDKANFKVHFVYYIMHGKKELDESLRQYCIQKEQNNKYFDYLTCFVQEGDFDKCASKVGIDVQKMENCINEVDEQYKVYENYNDTSTWYNGRFPKWDVELELNQKYGVRGSPTLVINDKVVSVSRTPEILKQTICNAFNNPPEECNQKLSENTPSPGFGSLEEVSSSSSGSCG